MVPTKCICGEELLFYPEVIVGDTMHLVDSPCYVMEGTTEELRKLAILVDAMRDIAGLKTKTLLGYDGMTYSDGAHNAFCEAASLAESALRKIR